MQNIARRDFITKCFGLAGIGLFGGQCFSEEKSVVDNDIISCVAPHVWFKRIKAEKNNPCTMLDGTEVLCAKIPVIDKIYYYIEPDTQQPNNEHKLIFPSKIENAPDNFEAYIPYEELMFLSDEGFSDKIYNRYAITLLEVMCEGVKKMVDFGKLDSYETLCRKICSYYRLPSDKIRATSVTYDHGTYYVFDVKNDCYVAPLLYEKNDIVTDTVTGDQTRRKQVKINFAIINPSKTNLVVVKKTW